MIPGSILTSPKCRKGIFKPTCKCLGYFLIVSHSHFDQDLAHSFFCTF